MACGLLYLNAGSGSGNFPYIVFPVLPIERLDVEEFVAIIQAPRVDVLAAGV